MSAWIASLLSRLLRPWLLAVSALLAGLAARGAGAGPDELAAATRALARTQAWSVLVLLAPFLAARAAAAARPAQQARWLAGGAARARLAAGPSVAACLAAVLVCALLLLTSEAVLPGGGDAARLLARPAGPELVLHEDDGPVSWSVARPPGATHARLGLGLAAGTQPGATLVLHARDGQASTRVERTLAARGTLELELAPASTGTLELTLERRGPGALVVLGTQALELVAPAGSERASALAFALQAALALAALLVLAQILAQLVAPALASALACALALLAARHGLAPVDGLVEACSELALARRPPAPTALGVLLTLGLAGAATALLARARRGGAP